MKHMKTYTLKYNGQFWYRENIKCYTYNGKEDGPSDNIVIYVEGFGDEIEVEIKARASLRELMVDKVAEIMSDVYSDEKSRYDALALRVVDAILLLQKGKTS